ncbi:hypothetical protein [Vulcanisaeta distributa]|uniref:hypothetical protein n=1 Tax=Vulcanisaeta distributa TaxID=164451 RepID=UPI0006D25EE1|nr:hypothetical protein [Vulcanisaeta distributa]
MKDGLLRVPLWIRWPNWFKAPKQTKPLISLTEVPSIIRMVINNNDSHEVGSSIAITESFGLTPFHKIDIKSLSHHELMKHFSHKIRVYTGKCVFTYNKSMDLVEESSCEDSVIKRIIDVVRPYAMSE